MIEAVIGQGYLYLFLLSFLASTVVPAGSEWLLAALVVKSLDPVILLASATAGNFLGACTTYAIGIYGGSLLIKRFLRIDEKDRSRAEKLYGKYGSWSLLLSWLPVVGDPLCLVGGVLRVPFPRFALFTFSGKLIRYLFVIVAARHFT